MILLQVVGQTKCRSSKWLNLHDLWLQVLGNTTLDDYVTDQISLHSWVMLDQRQSFVRLPGEDLIYTAPPRTSLSLTTPRSYPGNDPLSIKASVGNLYLTNQRVSSPGMTWRQASDMRRSYISQPRRLRNFNPLLVL